MLNKYQNVNKPHLSSLSIYFRQILKISVYKNKRNKLKKYIRRCKKKVLSTHISFPFFLHRKKKEI